MTCLVLLASGVLEGGADWPQISGIYPHLATFNDEGECGTGAVIEFADRLWVISYGPHLPFGSSDKLYEIAPDLTQTVRPESVGGTCANRLIHLETNQLLIGPYVVSADRSVRVIPYAQMPGRITATTRHLSEPAAKAYYATMEEGLYEVDLTSLDVKHLYADTNPPPATMPQPTNVPYSRLPGYHGKGAYVGQGRLVYSNNGEDSDLAREKPDIPSGSLSEWLDGTWHVVRRNQFCEVTGPGGIVGATKPDTDPIWSTGWDHRSLLLMVLDQGQWHVWRLPKSSHSYDGAHGWNTEWPRIRDIGEDDLLMTMHGAFWRFPRDFDASHARGIRPRSNYLKIIGDFAKWQDRLVFGCDDTAKSEFLNVRAAKGKISGPGQSQSNLWFVHPRDLDGFGPVLGRGGVWVNDNVPAGAASDPYLFAGYPQRGLHLSHGGGEPWTVKIERDLDGSGRWQAWREVTIAAGGARWVGFDTKDAGEWIRLRSDEPGIDVTAWFVYGGDDHRGTGANRDFAALAQAASQPPPGALLQVNGGGQKTLAVAAPDGLYELDGQLALRRVGGQAEAESVRARIPIPEGVLTADAASIIYTDDYGARWRLPRGSAGIDCVVGTGRHRLAREVTTERDLFNAGGLFYELPAENAGGVAKLRPIATHNRSIIDYCSYRGLLVLSGLGAEAQGGHVVRSDDGRVALWLGAVDDLWRLGKAVGRGGPWLATAVQAGQPSDPYVMAGFDAKRLTLSHQADHTVQFSIEVDASGDGHWHLYRQFDVPPGETVRYAFPTGFGAAWMRAVSDSPTEATVQLDYT